MTDPTPLINITHFIEVAKVLGLPGVILILWYMDQRGTQKILQQYRDDMAEQRGMYQNNAKLCESYMNIADTLQDLVVMNTQSQTKLTEQIDKNQFCPLVRGKRQIQPQEG